MHEKVIEQKLVKAVRAVRGMCVKIPPGSGYNGMPDRLALLPKAHCGFVEVKAPGKKPRPLQVLRHEQLKALGYPVYVLDDEQDIPAIINQLQGGDKDD